MPRMSQYLLALPAATLISTLFATGAGAGVMPTAATLEAPGPVTSTAPQADQPGWSTNFVDLPSELLNQGNGQQPIASGDSAIYSIAANPAPPRVARSESDWDHSKQGASLKAVAGNRIQASYVVQPTLGKSPMDDTGWVVVTQAQGPVGTPGTKQWIEPAFALTIRNGYWVMQGGDWGRGNQWYNLKLKPYQDGQAVKVRIDTLLGSGRAGAVKLWLDDKLVVDRQGITTIQADAWDGVRLRSGLYVGEQTTASAPTYARNVVIRNFTMAVQRG